MAKTVIFTDLDGSLLHPKMYSFEEASPALELIRVKDIPLILCSSKTRSEMVLYRERLRINDPFIVENGGAVFVPEEYFPFPAGDVLRDSYTVSVLGTPYQTIRHELITLRERLHIAIQGFGDMAVEEITELTGLSGAEAALARDREFSEPFIFQHGVDTRFLKAIEERGLHWTKGRLYCLMGNHDKGQAVRLLKSWYARLYGSLITIGLGDGLNDLPLLQEVDIPVLIQKEDGNYDPSVSLPRLTKANGIGPSGWSRAIIQHLTNE